MNKTGRKKEKILVIKLGRCDEYEDIQEASKATRISVSIIRTAVRTGKPIRGYCFDYCLDD